MARADFWLETPRLALRRFTLDDLDWFAELHADAGVTRYLGGPRDRAGAEELFHARILRYYDEHPGLGIWTTVERDTGLRVGYHLLNHIQGEPMIQVGYTLIPATWGRGYASEMAAAVVGYGFRELHIPCINGIASLANGASQRVLEKIGLRRRADRAFPHPAYAAEGPMAWFDRTAEEWIAEQSRLMP
jgi:RimJ/RimL family protein N-acetyltransferase